MTLRLAALAAAGILAMTALPVLAAAPDKAPLQFFADESPAGGKSTLTRSSDSVSAQVNAHNLMPGAAYTYWFVVFNLPENCSDGVCGEDDLFNDAVHPAVLGGNGEVANGGGHAVLNGTLVEGSSIGLDVVIGPGGLFESPYLLEDAITAEIHIVVRNHGPALAGTADLLEQLNTFGGNCDGIDPDGTFECVDEQFAVHQP